MSVTFSIAPSVLIEDKWVLECDCGYKKSEQQYASHEEAVASLETVEKLLCGDDYCAASGMHVTFAPQEGDDLSINLSNMNARVVMESLGYSNDEQIAFGDATGEDFLGRILTALALAPEDEGMPSYADEKEGQATMIYCGRRPGYLQERLEQLRALAEFSVATGRQIQWG